MSISNKFREDQASMDTAIKLESPLNCIVVGATCSGKTHLLYEILKHGEHMFTAKPTKIIYCYGVYQSLYDDMKTSISNIQFFEGLPSREDLDMWGLEKGHKILILDDLLQKAAKNTDIVDLFCQYSHHLNFSTFFVVQNLFANGKQFRTISLNTHYFILFKNQRDQLQIQTLGRQMFPGQLHFFTEAYQKATDPKYGYLLIDVSPHSDPKYKLRTHILPGQLMSVFLPENSKTV